MTRSLREAGYCVSFWLSGDKVAITNPTTGVGLPKD